MAIERPEAAAEAAVEACADREQQQAADDDRTLAQLSAAERAARKG